MKFLIPIAVALIGLTSANGAETASGDYPGLDELRLVTDVTSIQPGESFTVGLWIDHAEDFHTYWKNPGIVGIPTMFDWNLPEGWTASEIVWPVPQKTIMATLTAWGYEGDGTCLLVTLTPPKSINADEVTLNTRVGWMACARTCHPGWHDFSLSLPVSETPGPIDEKWSRIFEETRNALPPVATDDLNLSLTSPDSEGNFTLTINSSVPFPVDATAYFFSYDNQVDSDSPQTMVRKNDHTLELSLVYPEFAPEPQPKSLTGLIQLIGTSPTYRKISVDW